MNTSPNIPYNCPICLSSPNPPFSTSCGHVFCYECILTHLSTRKTCPSCQTYITPEALVAHQPSSSPCAVTPVRTPDLSGAHSSKRVAPPPLPKHNDITIHQQQKQSHTSSLIKQNENSLSQSTTANALATLLTNPNINQLSSEDLVAAGDQLSAHQLAGIIAKLHEKLQQKEGSERKLDSQLLLHFLSTTKQEKQTAVNDLKKEINLVETDIKTVQNDVILSNPETSTTTSIVEPILSKQSKSIDPLPISDLRTRKFSSLDSTNNILPSAKRFASSESNKLSTSSSGASDSQEKQKTPQNQHEDSRIAKKKQRLSEYFDILQKHYFSSVAYLQGESRKKALHSFQNDLVKLTSYNRFRDVATIGQVSRVDPGTVSDVFRTSNIVSSIEFNKDSELLATAGVTKRIQIFEYNNISENPNEIHYAVQDIPTTAKLSWVCWNPYIKQHLLSSDYEGFITLWDVYRGQAISEYEEHENRAWSVDFCPVQPAYFASGSDDGKVKLWSTTQSNSVLTIDNNSANVCSVKFHPTQAEKIAFGSVDLHVHYYDLRNTRQPLQVFKSHSRPVSYVKFMSPTQLVSASVDSTIKMWNLSDMSLERTFEGHQNDNNFVGLSVTEDYIACGSEENAVYCYYKAIPRPFTAFPFSLVDPLTGQESRDEDDSRFVSSVCWCPKDPTTLVAANSLGSVKILSLDHTDNSENTEEDDNNEGEKSSVS